MARYIDADELIKKIFPIGMVHDGKYTINAKAIKIAIDKTPTADVVPCAGVDELAKQHHDLIVEKDHLFDEVERLQHILDSYALQYGTVKDQQSAIDKAKAEVAKEIGEEIYRIIGECHNETWVCLLIKEFADRLVKGGAE